jgi:DNA polymerase elongation subunit (family B)
MSKPKILLFDIETTPNLAYVWAKYQQDVLEYVEEWDILCFGYKWLGQKRVTAVSTAKNGSEEDLVRKLWELFDEADIIIGHNGDRFDIRKSNAKFLEYGLTPPSSYQTIDTLKVARKYFNFNSNRLNDLAKTMGLGEKVQTGGFELWLGCMRDEPKSWKKMIEYCKHDVELLEKIYMEMRPWMTTHPNHNLFTGETHGCPVCASAKTQRRGFSHTRVGKRQRYQCMEEGCGAWSVGEIIRTDVITR